MIIALMVVRMPKLLYKVLSVCDLSKEVKIYKGLGRIPWPQLLIQWHHKNPKPLQTQNPANSAFVTQHASKCLV